MILLSWSFLILAIIYLIIQHLIQLFPNIGFIYYLIFFGCLLAAIMIMTLLLTFLLPVEFINYRKHTTIADSLLIKEIYFILYDLHVESNRWNELEFKREMIINLEDAARIVQYYIPKQLSSSDYHSNFCISETYNKIALGMRDLKKWIITSKIDTKDHFTKKIVSIFNNVLLGNWDALEIDSSAISLEYLPLRSKIFYLIHSLFIAFIPLIIYYGVQKTSLAISNAMKEYILIGLIIWASITLLSTFDPLLNEKLSAIKDLAKFLPGFGKFKNNK